MIIRQEKEFSYGYNSITELNGKHSDMLMDFGIIRFNKGYEYTNDEQLERTFLLIQGKITIEWEGNKKSLVRSNCFDENPWCLHVPEGIKVDITGEEEAEVSYQAVPNDNIFDSKFYSNEDLRSEQFGAGTLNETATRTVRTVIDDAIAPYSNLVIGEVIDHPGKWSSYPPHHHPQPEVYFYKFNPSNGFGYSEQGDDVYKVKNNDTACITGGLTHPQTAAPGYAMYYLWLIPHLKDARFNDRIFTDEHKWLLSKEAVIWPNK